MSKDPKQFDHRVLAEEEQNLPGEVSGASS